MNENTRKIVEEKTKEVLAAPSCCPELKEMAQKWLDAENTEKEAEVTKAYIQELSEDVLSIDTFIGLTESEHGVEIFGAEKAKEMGEAAKQAKAAGTKYCICPACTAGGAILDLKEEL